MGEKIERKAQNCLKGEEQYVAGGHFSWPLS